ncbi:MAG: DNA repair exonuclease [Candidatus Micrarchaeia archaeon]|jgi:DNA repair exonuclease SbcCD nuclease subunit
MKIAITGDFHLGFNQDALAQAKNALDACRDADAIIIAGDIFDSRIPRQETLNEALQLFSQAAESSKSDAAVYELDADGVITGLPNYPPILAIAGTHERRSKGLANPIHLLDSALCAVNVHGRRVCVQKAEEQVCFQAMAGVPEEFSRQVLKKMDFKPVGGAFNVFVFHQSLAEAMPFGESLCSQDLPEGFDLYIDGHIHWMAELVEGRKRIFIPGSTVVTQMRKNETRKKQVIIFDTQTGTYESRAFATRPFLYRDIIFEDPATSAEVVTQVDAALSEMLSSVHSQTPIVKLKLSGKLANGLESKDLDLSAIAKRYADRTMLHIDRDFERRDSAQADAEELQKARSDPRGVREISVELFIEALKRREIELTHGQAEELLDSLCEEDAARAAQLI